MTLKTNAKVPSKTYYIVYVPTRERENATIKYQQLLLEKQKYILLQELVIPLVILTQKSQPASKHFHQIGQSKTQMKVANFETNI